MKLIFNCEELNEDPVQIIGKFIKVYCSTINEYKDFLLTILN